MTFSAGQRLLASQLTGFPQLIGNTTLTTTATSITISVPSGFKNLQGIWTGRNDTFDGQWMNMQLNGDSSSNYVWQAVYGNATTSFNSNSGGTDTSIHIGTLPGVSATANYFATGTFTIGNITSSVFKPVSTHCQCPLTTTTAFSGTFGGLWRSTAAVTSVTLAPGGAAENLIAGTSFSLYGMP